MSNISSVALSTERSANIFLVQNNFSQQTAGHCLLQLQVSDDSLTVSILDKSTAKLIGFAAFFFDKLKSSVLLQIKSIFKTNDLFKLDFAQVVFVIRNRHFTFIPSPFFEIGNADSYLKASSYYNQNLKTSHKIIESVKAINVFQYDPEIIDYLHHYYSKGTVTHHHNVLIEGFSLLTRFNISNQVFVNLTDTFFDVVVFIKSKFVFANSFYFKTSEDVVYYLLFSLEQLGLNAKSSKVSLLGNKVDEQLNDKIAEYFNAVERLPLTSFVGRDEALQALKSNEYFTTENAFLCV